MKLREFLEREDISVAEFGRRVGVANRMTMLRYVSHERTPPKEVMSAIVRETGGAVRPDDFFEVSGATNAPTPLPAASPDPESERRVDHTALAAILDQLGGDIVIAEATRAVAVTDLEDMRRDGFIWSQFVKPLVAHARACGFDLDAERLVMRLNKDRGRAA